MGRCHGVERIMDGAERWREFWEAAKTDRQFIPNPATWLNQSRYDEKTPPIPEVTTADTQTMNAIDSVFGDLGEDDE
jgi:hypothetical protein